MCISIVFFNVFQLFLLAGFRGGRGGDRGGGRGRGGGGGGGGDWDCPS